MRRPERPSMEGVLTFAVTSGSCIAVLSAHPDGRRGTVGTDRSPLWFRASLGPGDAGQTRADPARNPLASARLPVGRLWGECYLFATDSHCPIAAQAAPIMNDILERAA